MFAKKIKFLTILIGVIIQLFTYKVWCFPVDTRVSLRATNININWWDNFSDPFLKEYIYAAIEKNHELKKATFVTEQYREILKSTFSNELPTLMFAPTFVRLKSAKNQIFDIETPQLRTNSYALPLVAQYEADIFLKNHDKTKASKKEFESYKYLEKSKDITLAADVATVYINIIKLDKIIKTQEKVNSIREQIRKLTQARYELGLASLYDVTYTDKLHTQSQIEINDLKKQRSLLLHQFAVYIDECPSFAEGLNRGDFDKFEYVGKLPTCLSSEIVVQRPDVMKAETDLAKAKIDIKIARKEFLPAVPILGVAGYNSLLLRNLFDWENIFGIIAVSAVQKIFTGGKLTSNLKKQKLHYEELFEAYKQADLVAIQEINDSLCLIKHDTQKDKDNFKKVALERTNFNLVEERYEAGVESYLSLIQYEENLLSLQIEKDRSKAQRLVDYISLYKATGAKL